MSVALLVSHIKDGWQCDGVLLAPQWSYFFGGLAKDDAEHAQLVKAVQELAIGEEITVGGRTYTKVKLIQ